MSQVQNPVAETISSFRDNNTDSMVYGPQADDIIDESNLDPNKQSQYPTVFTDIAEYDSRANFISSGKGTWDIEMHTPADQDDKVKRLTEALDLSQQSINSLQDTIVQLHSKNIQLTIDLGNAQKEYQLTNIELVKAQSQLQDLEPKYKEMHSRAQCLFNQRIRAQDEEITSANTETTIAKEEPKEEPIDKELGVPEESGLTSITSPAPCTKCDFSYVDSGINSMHDDSDQNKKARVSSDGTLGKAVAVKVVNPLIVNKNPLASSARSEPVEDSTEVDRLGSSKNTGTTSPILGQGDTAVAAPKNSTKAAHGVKTDNGYKEMAEAPTVNLNPPSSAVPEPSTVPPVTPAHGINEKSNQPLRITNSSQAKNLCAQEYKDKYPDAKQGVFDTYWNKIRNTPEGQNYKEREEAARQAKSKAVNHGKKAKAT
ncbi:hypothetical protein VNI00_017130 [Paramarasmius palmivorus]|uniref:Uncharacterized protein n=1 Tax=Paramarasmius palmivorus TaxID=297713 RepID=A0AAW0B8N1_9AGAR